MSILGKILAAKREEVDRRKDETFIPSGYGDQPPRSLQTALARGEDEPVRVIAEFKRASPSAGPIRPEADAATIALEYENGGAAAISVLTDKAFFDGDLRFLSQVKDAVSLPVLCKDFIIDPHQIIEARDAGADAILLIVAALPGAQLGKLHSIAAEHELDVLVEVHDASEVQRAVDVGARIIGVNHRDLTTFTVDLSLSAKLRGLIPHNAVLVGESGIRTPDDIERMRTIGADAVLVGESLMRQPSPGAALEALLAEPAS